MRLTELLRCSVTVIAISALPGTVIAKSANVPQYHIVQSRSVLAAGESVELKLEPTAPAGVQVNWSVMSGAMGIGLIPSGIYRAPFSVPAGTPPAVISCSLSGPGVKTSVMTEVELRPGSVPGSDDCLGPGQSYSTVTGDIIDSVPFEDGPALIQEATPIVPRAASARSVGGTVFVHALVCRSGRVLAAHVLARRFEPTDNHPGHEKQFDEAALTAARAYVFKPAMTGGQAVASWIEIPIIFEP